MILVLRALPTSACAFTGYYPNLIALYRSLGVQIRQADFSYSFSSLAFPTAKREHRTITTTVIYNGASGREGVSKPSFLRPGGGKKHHAIHAFGLELWSSVVFVYMTFQVVVCFLITLYHSLPFWRAKNIANITFRQWTLEVTPTGYLSRLVGMDAAWKQYVQMVLVPIVSAVCTAPETNVMDHPMEEILGECAIASSSNILSDVSHRLCLADVRHSPLRCPWRGAEYRSAPHRKSGAFPSGFSHSVDKA